jgi:hypothetical protein
LIPQKASQARVFSGVQKLASARIGKPMHSDSDLKRDLNTRRRI